MSEDERVTVVDSTEGLRQALAESTDGDRIIVCPGTYGPVVIRNRVIVQGPGRLPDPEPVSLVADDWFHIAGRGRVAAFSNEKLIGAGMYDPGQFMGQVVRIDGDLYRVTGVERQGMEGRSPEQPYKRSFGLLTMPVTDEGEQ